MIAIVHKWRLTILFGGRKTLNAEEMKLVFYPEVNKDKLFSSGYIASRSGIQKEIPLI